MIRALALLALLALTAAPAGATQDRYPALYDVTGVEASDRLNIRSGPGAEYEIVGSLDSGQQGVEIIAPNEPQTWGKVNFGEGWGWVSLTFLTRQPGQWYGAVPDPMRCFGTEPFWTLDIEGEIARLSRPDSDDVPFTRTVVTGSANNPGHAAWAFQHELGGMFAAARLNECTDGMSDRLFGIEIDLLVALAGDANAQMFTGCCTIAP